MSVKTTKLATNPTLDGLKKSIAKYWYTDVEKITFLRGKVLQDGEIMNGFFIKTISGGYSFVHEI